MFEYERLKKILEERGLTAYKVSKDTGIAQTSFSDWKKGKSKPSVEKIKILSDYLGVSLEYLLGGNEETGLDNNLKPISGFNSAEDAVKFILEQPMVAQFGGYDLEKMTDEEIIEFANDVAGMIELLGKKYKK
ncbi:helix-turn-helix domain-containing protein [Holdemania filiformis]|uniref:helix-turn-helix domain-containing protein n=1 Tax=Holdemania filiformis TaxID=61171 RepID=UPI002432E081|nr:helix-turn-helix transcriptional regulator [Holdemania filiformis]